MLNGRADAFDFSVTRVVMVGGDAVTLAPVGVTAIVGGNNVGKSTFLRNLRDHLAAMPDDPPHGVQIMSSVESNKNGSGRDLAAWLGERSQYIETPAQAGFSSGNSNILNLRDIAHFWSQSGGHLTAFVAPFTLLYADARERLNFQHEVQQRSDLSDPPTHPLHRLQDDPDLLGSVGEYCAEVFRVALTLDRLSLNVRLRIGTPAVEAPPIDAITAEYRRELAALSPVSEQGDGLRSFLSILLPLITGTSKIVLIDEPEAFLHPPQAHALGRIIAELARDKKVQVVLATHDRHLLAGLLEPEGADVSVVRLARGLGDGVEANQLENSDLRKFWSDPTLRYTNLLDGLFHRMVVICEADRDCSFYAAALESANAAARTSMPPSEVLFVPSGGKDGMKVLASMLRRVRVPVVLSPDMDLLDDKGKLQAALSAMGQSWEPFERDWSVATERFRQAREPVYGRDILFALTAVLEPIKEQVYTSETKKQVTAQLRIGESPWKELKRYGTDAFRGEAAAAGERLLNALDEVGIVIVRPGELERMVPELGVAKGPGWLPAALGVDGQSGERARKHVARLINSGAAR